MTKQQVRLCRLMREFHTICERVGVPYYLVAHQLYHAVKRHGIHGYEIDLAMYKEHWDRIWCELGEGGAYEVESVTDGGRLPGCFYRFVDRSTLLLDVDWYEEYAKPGIGLNIHIIRRHTPASFLFLKQEKRLEEHLMLKRELSSEEIEQIQQKFLKNCAAPGNGGIIREPFGRICYLSAQELKRPKPITLQGMSLMSIRHPEFYLKQRYPKGFQKQGARPFKVETYRCIFSEKLPYARFMEAVEKEDLLSRELSLTARAYGQRYAKFTEMMKEERAGWDKTMFVTGERYRLWKKYMPIKDGVLALMNAGQYDEAEIVMQDYLDVLKTFSAGDMAVCFDKELFETALTLLEMNHQERLAEKLRTQVLQEDFETMKNVGSAQDETAN